MFLLLKLERLTAVDLDDCLALLTHCAATGEAVDRARIHARLTALAPTADAALVERRAAFAAAIAE